MSTHTLTIRKTCLYPFELYFIQSDMQTDMCMHMHKTRMSGPPATQSLQTTISCSVLTNRGTKAVMSQLLQTHLKRSPDWLNADGRDR